MTESDESYCLRECWRILRAGACAGLLLFTSLAWGGGPDAAIDARAYDLERPEEVQQLYRLLKRAARSACSDSQIADSNVHTLSWLKCVSGMLDAAVERLDRPALTAYHLAHGFGIRDEPEKSRIPGVKGAAWSREKSGSQRAGSSAGQPVGRSASFGDCPWGACGYSSPWLARSALRARRSRLE
jgi:UrcA family protein